MNSKPFGDWLAERVPLPDGALKLAIASRVANTRRELAMLDTFAEEARFLSEMAKRPIAEFTEAANQQHYELPAAFFEYVLGPRRKYSCCLYEPGVAGLPEAEERALAVTAERATLADGQTILELGCGWGSLSLFMAERYPGARIVSVSNSRSQREYIEKQISVRKLGNLRVVTADMNEFVPDRLFDRIVSVEMFEHMSNWPSLLDRVAQWLNPDGRLFLHVFSHRSVPYRFDHSNGGDWIARYFFTGGMMPSHRLIKRCEGALQVEAEWQWSGAHYQRTALDWLRNFDREIETIGPILDDVYGRDAGLWRRRWRLFFLATAGLFGDNDGATWGISHYRLQKRPV